MVPIKRYIAQTAILIKRWPGWISAAGQASGREKHRQGADVEKLGAAYVKLE